MQTVQNYLETAKQAVRQLFINMQKHMLIPLSKRLGDIRDDPRSFKERFLSANTLLWLGIGMGVTGILMLLSPQSFQHWQFLLIPVVAFVGSNVFNLFSETSAEARQQYESYQGQRLLGKVFILKLPIQNGKSQIKIEEDLWELRGDDCPAGVKVKVVAVGDETLHVVPYV